MNKVRIALLAFAVFLGVCQARAGEMSEGEKLEMKMWKAVMDGDNAAIESMVAPGFQSVHEDGARDRAGELKLLEELDPAEVKLSNFKVTEQGRRHNRHIRCVGIRDDRRQEAPRHGPFAETERMARDAFRMAVGGACQPEPHEELKPAGQKLMAESLVSFIEKETGKER